MVRRLSRVSNSTHEEKNQDLKAAKIIRTISLLFQRYIPPSEIFQLFLPVSAHRPMSY